MNEVFSTATRTRWCLVLVSCFLFICFINCDRRPRSAPIEVGQTINSQLERGDHTDVFADGSYADLYEITLNAGQQITVELSSRAFDTYLSLMRGPGDQIIDNDDISSDDTNSRLTYRAQAASQYFIAVTTFRAGDTGSYTLRVVESDSQTEATEAAPLKKSQ